MHQHNGIVVVAFKPGQPASQTEADLQTAGLYDFTTSVFHHEDGEAGRACKVNLIDEANDLVIELQDAGFNSVVIQAGVVSGWQV